MNEEIEKLLHREHLQLASIKKRAMAFFIDEMLLSFLLIIAMSDSFSNAQTVEDVIVLTNSYVMQYIIIKIVYQTFFVMQYGATLGKLAMKIKILAIQTVDNPNFTVALNRAVFRIISEMIFYLGFLWGMFDPQRQTWHDKTARTLVIDA